MQPAVELSGKEAMQMEGTHSAVKLGGGESAVVTNVG